MFAQKKNDSSQKLSHSEATIAVAYGKNDMAEKLEDVTDRKSTVRGNCSHFRARLASFVEAAMAAKLVVVGEALVSLSISPATSQMPFFERIMDAIILVDLLIPLIRLFYLLLEIKIIRQLKHPNTVKCYGNEILAESVGKHLELGTPCYVAPEVLPKIEYKRSLEASAADIWSLGCVIIKMFSGKHPWPGFEPVQAFYKVCVEQQHPPIPEGLCEEGKGFVELCFTRTPAERPSAAALPDHSFVRAQTT
ncbi:mitogen-activated protein kinase kinase kinase YODA-like [Neltuma alba]|uniref:mitogen-activated protein kinase kinase kinase YODA-like n=1 Tax=Neltuma alba TaxID=207710 RepID=UPI0010A37B8A|nr:mitogen-activated protein kinase kinase kinase YODA-like [Prosopis alba]